jgi:tropomyosin
MRSMHMLLSVQFCSLGANLRAGGRLRQTDVKAGHYERKVQALEQARDQWETKYEDMAKKYADLQKELHELEVSMGNI